MTILQSIDNAPVNKRSTETTDHPKNWIVFTTYNGHKKQFVRIHPNYILDERDYFKAEDLANFEDAWDFIAEGEIEESKLESVRPYVTFILNKTAHLYLESREIIADMIQDGSLTLIDCYISNN